MYQPWLLLVELAVLGATIYFFWLTQQAGSPNSADIEQKMSKIVRERITAQNEAMTHDVGALVQEMETTAAEMRAQWTRQSLLLQDAIRRVNETDVRLKTLTAQVETPQTAAVSTPQSAGADNTLGDALAEYRRYLLTAGRPAGSANRIVGHVRGFALWWGGRQYEQMQVRPINPAEAEAYNQYLRDGGLKTATIRRKLNAVKEFLRWLEMQVRPAVPPPIAAPSQVKAVIPAAADRRTRVHSLAEQGLDVRTIAARTEMEQEAVRILLRDDV